jgi:hypothetical protein
MFGERLPSDEVLRNRESAEPELGGLLLLWVCFELLAGEADETVTLTGARVAGGAATAVVIVAVGFRGGGYQGGLASKRRVEKPHACG